MAQNVPPASQGGAAPDPYQQQPPQSQPSAQGLPSQYAAVTGDGLQVEESSTVLATAVAQQAQPLDDVHLDELLEIVVQNDASDLHIAAGLPPVMRVDGELRPITQYDRFTGPITQRMVYDILSDDQIQRFETELELDCSYSLKKVARFRVNVFRDRGTVAAAFRLIPTRIPTIRELGLPLILEELSRRPRGLILVTGPTGHGKSTTLAAMINQINQERSLHVITIEDPIEYLHTHNRCIINQRELGFDTRGFNNALRAALREDPDVLLVGEMRDLETIQLAITCAETGHLVMATLHTNNAAESVDRVIDVFPADEQEQIRVQLSNNLAAVISQQLLPRAGEPGRVAAVEVMIASPAIRNLIRENKAHQITSIVQTSGDLGMQTMDMALRDLYQQGLITYETAMARAMNPDELRKMMYGSDAA
ncbi:MAG: type IV pilus twitching motility protein PilT [Armatimonadota bacterium]